MNSAVEHGDRRAQRAWASFHFARDAYGSLIIIYLFGPYFVTEVIGDPVRGQEIWGYINVIAALFAAALAPVFGAIADKAGRRKPWLAAFVAVAVPAIALLWFAKPADQGLSIVTVAVALTIAGTAVSFSIVFHNAMLPTVVEYRRLGRVSGLGLALGAVASVVLLSAMLYAFALPATGVFDWAWLPEKVLFGLDTAAFEHERIVAPVMAAWFAIFSIPFFLYTPDGQATGVGAGRAIRAGLSDLWTTVRRLPRYKNIGIYLLARMAYNDAVVALFTFGMIYAAGIFGWGAAERLIVGITFTLFAVAGSILGGKVDDLIGSKRTLIITIVGNAVLLLVAVSITRDTLFFMRFEALDRPVWNFPYFRTLPELIYLANSLLFSLFIPAASTASRTMLARIAPPHEITKFYGLYALSGELTVFVGPLLVAVVTGYFASQRAGMASILLLLAAGFIAMLFVRERPAVIAAK